MRRAVVDVGSNSVLLTVAEGTNGAWREVLWTSEVTGLGTDTKATGLLGEDSMARTLAAVRRAFDLAGEHGAACAAAGTMALRIATNANKFLERASEQGTPVAVLTGDEEARYGLAAVLGDGLFASEPRISVIDPGGHSTELTVAQRQGRQVEFQRSFPIGALGMLEGPMGAESPDSAARLKATCEIDALFEGVLLPEQAGTVVALGATPTNLAQIRNQADAAQTQEVHGAKLSYEEVSRWMAALCEMTEAQRAAVPGMEAGREKTLHIGALILERFLHALHKEECTVSVRGWRWALLDEDVYFS